MYGPDYLSRKLSALGVEKGDTLFIHSAFSAVGPVEGGAEGFLDALAEAVGPEGTLVFPTFSSSGKPFSVTDTPSKTGLLSEMFRLRPGALRSRQPTHSVAAAGRRAAEITGGEWVMETTCGEGSPFAYLARSDAKQMMLGVDLNRCTMMHACEDMAGFGFLVPQIIVAPPEGAPGITHIHNNPPGHRAFIHMMHRARGMDWFIQGYIGAARVLLYPIRKMHELCLELLIENKYLFLCENESCNSCMEMRGRTPDPELTGTCAAEKCEVCRFTESYLCAEN